MRDHQILWEISRLTGEEHRLRERLTAGEISPEEGAEEMRCIEQALDRCWDLVRQRRARRDAGEDPDHASPRPVSEIEDYGQ
ncbi:DUF2630 family protein [Sphaerimonospora thailandensis]|uniref:DUF2630 family protein n=1 Tax=Sphaerimonospora thailandensis TaxID=795644 RepID=A0A8J3VX73_9ACTN|nr:DUF2630 family protein [Sphaerimonospora thailandensis]GIH68629.1 hypothetical protein Mth01_08820 [Sphaerimonospora thailandensis]